MTKFLIEAFGSVRVPLSLFAGNFIENGDSGDSMEEITISGYVEHIVFRNEENGYTVMEVSTKEKTRTLVGNLLEVQEGEYLEATGYETKHPLYGEQFQVLKAEAKPPKDLASIERYLGSGAIKGIGQALAGRIVEQFQADTFRIIEEEPERLAEVYGILVLNKKYRLPWQRYLKVNYVQIHQNHNNTDVMLENLLRLKLLVLLGYLKHNF